jgi:hypothetical protein
MNIDLTGLLQPIFLRLLTLTFASSLLVNPTSAKNTLQAATSPDSTGKKPNIVLIVTGRLVNLQNP